MALGGRGWTKVGSFDRLLVVAIGCRSSSIVRSTIMPLVVGLSNVGFEASRFWDGNDAAKFVNTLLIDRNAQKLTK